MYTMDRHYDVSAKNLYQKKSPPEISLFQKFDCPISPQAITYRYGVLNAHQMQKSSKNYLKISARDREENELSHN